MKILCPKCRSLGLQSDCSDQLNHAGRTMSDDHGDYELEVTLTFAVPVTSTLPYDRHEMATHMRETWINEESQLQDVLLESVFGEYDLQVRPVGTS